MDRPRTSCPIYRLLVLHFDPIISVVKHHHDTGQAAYRVIHEETIGCDKTCKATSAEIHAIMTAVEYARKEKGTVWIMSDSQEALKRISNGDRSKSSRELVSVTPRDLQLARKRGMKIKLLWIPGHKGIAGNELAHSAAQETTSPHRSPAASFSCCRCDVQVEQCKMMCLMDSTPSLHSQIGLAICRVLACAGIPASSCDSAPYSRSVCLHGAALSSE